MGLIAATSGCPHTAFFKPMARFHLPVASLEETLYRALSMYMLGQFFRHKRGMKVDMDFRGLVKRYQHIDQVNKHLAKRLRAAHKEDATLNAVVMLDTLAQSMPAMMSDSMDIEDLFKAIKQDCE